MRSPQNPQNPWGIWTIWVMNLKKVTKIAQIAQNPRVLTIELIKENDFLVKNFVSPRFCQWVVKFGHFHKNGRKTTLIHMT